MRTPISGFDKINNDSYKNEQLFEELKKQSQEYWSHPKGYHGILKKEFQDPDNLQLQQQKMIKYKQELDEQIRMIQQRKLLEKKKRNQEDLVLENKIRREIEELEMRNESQILKKNNTSTNNNITQNNSLNSSLNNSMVKSKNNNKYIDSLRHMQDVRQQQEQQQRKKEKSQQNSFAFAESLNYSQVNYNNNNNNSKNPMIFQNVGFNINAEGPDLDYIKDYYRHTSNQLNQDMLRIKNTIIDEQLYQEQDDDKDYNENQIQYIQNKNNASRFMNTPKLKNINNNSFMENSQNQNLNSNDNDNNFSRVPSRELQGTSKKKQIILQKIQRNCQKQVAKNFRRNSDIYNYSYTGVNDQELQNLIDEDPIQYQKKKDELYFKDSQQNFLKNLRGNKKRQQRQ
ncbi:hypothetical protein PPERSA_00002 [Pseudocohnilembus persalinus]|uniref:Uncharacterized protein n=1 Tax=Pseudocohnilembus persalinus TaxID=266149 RepID=A0A0V0QVN4_PSEPJ|nr:hypothetical protein PPERSA_00002 [Pseudocohnilembus persalinus]|eukprot:KRX06122.1 hypothetical protein PPERSA_00002 [Pseudocohnilembus persalinus]